MAHGEQRDPPGLRQLLEAVPDLAVFVDREGTIVEVNRSWSDVAETNGGTAATVGPGVSYLAACDRADESDVVAHDVAADLRRVLAGGTGNRNTSRYRRSSASSRRSDSGATGSRPGTRSR